MGLRRTDALLSVSKALPSGASSVQTDAIDLENSALGDLVAPFELEISAPVLAVGELANGSTMKYIVQHDTDSAFGTVTDLIPVAVLQTGAGGAGAAAQTVVVRLPVDTKRYIRVKATNSAAADASAKSVTAKLKF